VVETSGAVRTRGNRSANSVTSPPAEVERCVSASTEGVSTHTAAEMAKRKDTKQTNTNKSKLVQRVLPTRSHSARAEHASVQESKEMEREVQQLLKSMLRKPKQVSDHGHTHGEDAPRTTTAQLPEALLHWSREELNHLVSYICHNFKDTLQSTVVEQALTAQQQTSADKKTGQTAVSTKHVQINEDPVSVQTVATAADGSESPNGRAGSGGKSGRVTEDRVHRRRHKRSRRERPMSNPDTCWLEDTHLNLSDPQSSHSRGAVQQTSPSPPNELQSQSHSNEESYYHRCSGEHSPEVNQRTRRRNCHSPPNTEQFHNGATRKRVGRSKDRPVDVSLDDNCPGVNIVRRRYPHHHHTVCDNCLQSLGKETFCRQGRRRHKQPQSPEIPSNGDLQLSPEDQATTRGVGEGSGFITLNQLRTVAQAIKENTSHMDQNLEQFERTQRRPSKSQSFRNEKRHHYRVKTKRRSAAVDDCQSVTPTQQMEDLNATLTPSTPEELGHFQELVHPLKTRSGRDSPATDMAVIDLSVDSPCMLRPLDKDRSNETTSYTICDNNSPNKIMHLHHHYHHIIHHGDP
jgi:hypothetical protein